MTANEMNSLIGRHVYLEPAPGLQFRCRITNVKTSYGRARVEIEAIAGEGTAWVALESIHRLTDGSTGSSETISPCYSPQTATAEGSRHADAAAR